MDNKINKAPYILTIILDVIAISLGFVLLRLFFSNETQLSDSYLTIVRVVHIFALSFLLIINAVELISLFFDKTATKNTLFFALGIALFLATSNDFLIILNIQMQYPFFEIIHFIFFVFLQFFFYKFVNNDYSISASKNENAIIFIMYILITIAGSILVAFDYHFIALLLAFALGLFQFIKAFITIYVKKRINAIFIVSSLIFFSICGAEVTSCSAIQFNMPTYPLGFTSFSCLFVCVLFIVIYLFFTINKTKDAYNNRIYREQIAELQAAILKEQINPHFIFNSLNLIKTIYRQDKEKGDFAVDMLSKHLRNNIQATSGNVFISLEDELKNIKCYVDLAKLQYEKDFNVIFNIEDIDVKVPILSIETFVENCIRYSHITEKEDGYIEISTEELDDKYVIKVIDNGSGFDVNKVKKNSYGIDNAKNRFQLLLNGTVDVHSEIGVGTEITIIIPKKESGKND